MKNRLLPFLITMTPIVLMLNFQSCNLWPDNDPPQIDTFYLDQEFLDYTYLTPGHYWVYREINTGEIDSTYATLNPNSGYKTSEFWKPQGGGAWIERTRHEHRRIRYFLRGEWTAGEWYLGDDPITEIESDMSIFFLEMADQNKGSITAQKDHSQSWEIMDIVDSDFYTTFHDELQLGDSTYHNVVQVQIAPSWESSAWIYQSYFVRDIGVVYREFYDGTAWELIRHGTF